LQVVPEEGTGKLLDEHQEGRGIGLMEKLRAYPLQDQGLDTIEANLQLGHAIDSRDYQLAVEILHFLKVPSLRLMTNNPEKVNAVLTSGIEIGERISADVPGSPYSADYLAIKREKLGHFSDGMKRTPGGSSRLSSCWRLVTESSASGDGRVNPALSGPAKKDDIELTFLRQVPGKGKTTLTL
jgi:hypothetical protein